MMKNLLILHSAFLALAILSCSFISAQTFSGAIIYSCSPTSDHGFAPAEVEVITHKGQFRITERSENNRAQSFLLLGPVLGSVNQFSFFNTDIALTGPLPSSRDEVTIDTNANSRMIAGITCYPCGTNWCAPSLGASPAGWPGPSFPLEAEITYGNISYNIVATSVTPLSNSDFQRKGEYAKSFTVDSKRTVVDAKGFLELFQLAPPAESIRY